MADKTTDELRVQIVLQVPNRMRLQIEREARRAGVSRSEIIRRALAAVLDAPKPGKGAAA